MSNEHDESRRAFLVGTAVGAAGAVAGTVSEAEARPHRHGGHGAKAADAAAGGARRVSGGHGAFLNDDQLSTVAAIAERIMPGAPGKPGATDADVVNYIDLALAGAYSDLGDFYRRGLAALDAHCQATYKESFVFLKPEQQDEALTACEQGKATGFTWPAPQAFFGTLRTHTMEGMFADPIYGGNKDFAGWKLVGFPGAQPAYTAADMRSDKPFTRLPPIGIAHRSAGAPAPRKRG
jgi:gluconate 2-dehydrogenase gamma chain